MTKRKRTSKVEKINRAWTIFCDGDLIKAYGAIDRALHSRSSRHKDEYIKKQLSEVEWLREYDFPELKHLPQKAKNEFIQISSWNSLLSVFDPYHHYAFPTYNKEHLAPLISNLYYLDVDINAIQKILIDSGSPITLITQEKCFETWPELLNLENLSLDARSLFIRIIKYAQIRWGGITDGQRIELQDDPKKKKGLIELSQAGIVKTNNLDDVLSDVLMTKTSKELKKFAFDNNLSSNGTKYKVIQTIVNGVDYESIKTKLDIKSEDVYIRPMFSETPSLKKYIWSNDRVIKLYLEWIHEIKYLKKSDTDLASEHEEHINKTREKQRYKPDRPENRGNGLGNP